MMLLEVILPLALIAPGFVLQTKIPLKFNSIAERLTVSYTLSLALIFPLLYIGALTFTFLAASLLVLLVSLASAIYLLVSFVINGLPSSSLSSSSEPRLSRSAIVGILSTGGLVLVLVVVLSLRPILDSDVAQFYLPIAREIARFDGFTYSTGYDYNILLKPIGASVLYAWSYVLSGSTTTEAFRLLPVVPIIVMMGGIYAIAKEVTQKQDAAVLSVIIFAVLPFQDRLMLYNAFYPDTYYYPLVFTAILLLVKYSKTRDWSVLLVAGIALGVSGLLKAQTIYVVIVVLAIILFLDLGWKRVNPLVCFIVPFAIFVPNLLIETIRRLGLSLSLAGFSIDTLPLFFFLGIVSMATYILLTRYGFNSTSSHLSGLLRFVRRASVFLIPVLLISSLWYVTNFLRFGSIISTSTIDLPNYDWALDILESAAPPLSTVSVSNYFAYFAFMFFDPAVFGYVWFVVIITGSLVFIKLRVEGSGTLVMISMLFAVVIFAQVVYAIPAVGASAYNPRDIFLLAPLLCITSSVGILHVTRKRNEGSNSAHSLGWAPLLLVSFYGFLGYVHSVVMWFANISLPSSPILEILNSMVSIFGFSLKETSLQLIAVERIPFPLTHAIPLAIFSITAGLPVIVLLLKNTGAGRFYSEKIQRLVWVSVGVKRARQMSTKQISLETVMMSFLILSVILVPRGLLYLQGGMSGVSSYSLEITYRGLHEMDSTIQGGILTYKAPDGLPYYLPDNRIIDLRWAANLAYFRDSLTLEDAREVVGSLRDLGITHLLINPSILGELDHALDNIFSTIANDVFLGVELHSFGGWKLYKLGPFTVERTLYSSTSWNISSRWTNASYTFVANESGVYLGLLPDSDHSRMTVFAEDGPELSLRDYDLVQVRLRGTSNARLLVRFFLDDNSGLDLAYWMEPGELNVTSISLSAYSDRLLRGDIYVGLTSSDGQPASAEIIEIAFLTINPLIPA